MSFWAWLLIVVIALVVGFALLVRFVKAFARTIVLLVVLGLVVAGSIYVIRDANDLRENFIPGAKLIVLDMDGSIVAAVTSRNTSIPLPAADVAGFNALYRSKNYEAILGNNYKLLVFRWDAFKELKILGDGKYSFAIDDVKKIMAVENPKKYYIERQLGGSAAEFAGLVSSQVDRDFPTNDYFRSFVFGLMIAESFGDASVFEAYANEDVWVYPETIALKLVRWLPFSWVQGFVADKM